MIRAKLQGSATDELQPDNRFYVDSIASRKVKSIYMLSSVVLIILYTWHRNNEYSDYNCFYIDYPEMPHLKNYWKH